MHIRLGISFIKRARSDVSYTFRYVFRTSSHIKCSSGEIYIFVKIAAIAAPTFYHYRF